MAVTTIRYHFSRVSRNTKTGPIPVTTTGAASCPPSCGLIAACYANSGPLRIHWDHISNGVRGSTLADLCLDIRRLPGGQLWRHNQAGDLPGTGNAIDAPALAELVHANRGRRGFTYTHKPLTVDNLTAMHAAVDAGFIINLSADDAALADTLAVHNLPVVVVVPADAPKVSFTPLGGKIVLCPAESSDKITCANCGLCAIADRPYMIGFKPKGSNRGALDRKLKGTNTP